MIVANVVVVAVSCGEKTHLPLSSFPTIASYGVFLCWNFSLNG